MLARKIIASVLIAALPLTATADSASYRGVVGTRLLTDIYAQGDHLYLGFANDTDTTIRIESAQPGGTPSGFFSISMPRALAPYTKPRRADPEGAYARANPLLHASGLDFADFPQPGQGDLRYRVHVGEGRIKQTYVDENASVTYRLRPEGEGVGPQSGVDLTLHWARVPEDIDIGNALIQIGVLVVSSGILSAGLMTRALRKQYPGASLTEQWTNLRMDTNSSNLGVLGMYLSGVPTLSSVGGMLMLLGEGAYYVGASAYGGKAMFNSTYAYALLGGAGVKPLLQTPLQQTVYSPDGRFEYSLSVISLPYATGAQSFNVPKKDDALLVLGVRRVWSAQQSCTGMLLGADDAHPTLLQGDCMSNAALPVRGPTALDLELCVPNTDISNVDGRLQCASRFSGPFEQQFHKYDGNLRGAYVLGEHGLSVYSNDERPRVLATLPHPELCRPGSISFAARTQLKAQYTLSCQYQ